MTDRSRKIWQWVSYGVLATGFVIFAQRGLRQEPSITFRRAVILNDDDAITRELEDSIKQAERAKALLQEKGQRPIEPQ